MLVFWHWCIARKDPKVIGYREVEVGVVVGVGWLLVVWLKVHAACVFGCWNRRWVAKQKRLTFSKPMKHILHVLNNLLLCQSQFQRCHSS